MAIEVRWGSATHVGCVRSANQDAVLGGPVVFAVADGMGGHAAGDVASALAVAELAKLASGSASAAVADVVRSANGSILDHAVPGSGREGMGTTVTGVCLAREGDRDIVVIFNVGDSRTYRLDAAGLTQVTTDHSLVAEMVRDGELAESDAERHPTRNVVTRALGIDAEVEVDVWEEEPRAGVMFLMCSDGLANEVSSSAMEAVLVGDGTPQQMADALVEQALQAGAHDNVSVVVLAVDGVTSAMPLADDTNPRGVAPVAPDATEAPGLADLIASVPGVAPEPSQRAGDTPPLLDLPSQLGHGAADD